MKENNLQNSEKYYTDKLENFYKKCTYLQPGTKAIMINNLLKRTKDKTNIYKETERTF